MKNNLQYLTKWCHSMGYSTIIGHNIISIRYKRKCKLENIQNIMKMSQAELRTLFGLIRIYMEGK